MMPAITCIVPTLNSAETLEQTLLSLRNQRGVDVEIVLADSGSTDGTLDIASRWSVETVFEPPGNMYRAINAGLARANTEFATYLNSDDAIYSDAYATLLEAIGSGGAAYADCDFIDWEGRFLGSLKAARPEELLRIGRTGLFALMQPASLFRTSLWADLRGFDPSFRYAADADFFFRALREGYTFAYRERPVACFRVHETQLTSTRAREIQEEEKRIRRILGSPEPIRDWAARTAWKRRNLGNYLVRVARRRLVRGEFRLARSMEP